MSFFVLLKLAALLKKNMEDLGETKTTYTYVNIYCNGDTRFKQENTKKKTTQQ